MDNWITTHITFNYRCFKYFYMFQFLCMFHFLLKVIYFKKNCITLHYVLHFKYGDHGFLQRFSLLMPISIMQWRVDIGMFNPTHKTRFINLELLRKVGLSFGFHLGIRFVFVVLMLFVCGDIELNPDPKQGVLATIYQFAIGIFIASLHTILKKKIVLLQAYNTIHRFEMICLSKFYVDASLSSDKDKSDHKRLQVSKR